MVCDTKHKGLEEELLNATNAIIGGRAAKLPKSFYILCLTNRFVSYVYFVLF